MASAGQRFELDLDSDDFTINLHNDDGNDLPGFAVKEIQEHEDSAQQKAEISKENDKRLAEMSEEEIAAARAELLGALSPDLLERLLKRANIDQDSITQDAPRPARRDPSSGNHPQNKSHDKSSDGDGDGDTKQKHDNSPSFLTDLHATYFPSLPHNPSSLSPSLASLPASALRFSFTGRLITPRESLAIPVTEGLHHHGQAPSSAGYTVPELTLLARSAMPNQRCVAYQTVGRLLYRLGKGEFAGGPNGSELEDAIWDVIERERILELVLAEAGKSSGHLSARKYATEALWLWRRGGGDAPERGLRKPQHRSDMQSIQEEA
ncbi:hypothetical protein DV738_g1865, partial [Chaetothyriales sp. CBS 135597]